MWTPYTKKASPKFNFSKRASPYVKALFFLKKKSTYITTITEKKKEKKNAAEKEEEERRKKKKNGQLGNLIFKIRSVRSEIDVDFSKKKN